MQEPYATFQKDAKIQVESGNYATDTRVRKAFLKFEKPMK
ncbi:hypothetical protein [uncultured Bacteroides sp.]